MDRLRQKLEARPEVREAYLFGSRTSGPAPTCNDVDVAVYLDTAVSTTRDERVTTLAIDIRACLGSDRVDVVILNRVSPTRYRRILRDGIRLFARDPAATAAREKRVLTR